jgi:cobalamin biosynthesis Mg chelatase CobN
MDPKGRLTLSLSAASVGREVAPAIQQGDAMTFRRALSAFALGSLLAAGTPAVAEERTPVPAASPATPATTAAAPAPAATSPTGEAPATAAAAPSSPAPAAARAPAEKTTSEVPAGASRTTTIVIGLIVLLLLIVLVVLGTRKQE